MMMISLGKNEEQLFKARYSTKIKIDTMSTNGVRNVMKASRNFICSQKLDKTYQALKRFGEKC